MFPERETNLGLEGKKKKLLFCWRYFPRTTRVNICDTLVWTLYHLVLKHFYEMLQKVLEYPISADMVGLGKCHSPGWSPNFSCLLANDIYFNNSSENKRPLLFPLHEQIMRNSPISYSCLWNLCVVVAKECFLSRVDLKI